MSEICDIHLVAGEAAPPLSLVRWASVRKLLLERQPARSAFPEGDPPRAIWIESYSGTEVAPGLLTSVEQLTGTTLRVEPVSLRDLRTGFRDRYQRIRVAALIGDRLADDRDQDECRYLIRFCWQLSMRYNEVTMPELREHVAEAKLGVIGELIRAIRQSPESVNAWIHAVEDTWPVIQDRSFHEHEADT